MIAILRRLFRRPPAPTLPEHVNARCVVPEYRTYSAPRLLTDFIVPPEDMARVQQALSREIGAAMQRRLDDAFRNGAPVDTGRPRESWRGTWFDPTIRFGYHYQPYYSGPGAWTNPTIGGDASERGTPPDDLPDNDLAWMENDGT